MNTDLVSSTDSDEYVSFAIKSEKNFPIGIAEASFLPDKNCFYFNRLFVNKEYRNKGYGANLLNSLLRYMDYIGIDLILDINPYGDLNYEQLENFYMKHGFEKFEQSYIYKPKKRK